MKLTENRAYFLTWAEASSAAAKGIEESLGLRLPCAAGIVDGSYWEVAFPSGRMPLSQLCRLLVQTGAPEKVWAAALPDEGAQVVTGLGRELSALLIQKSLCLAGCQALPTPEGLWLVAAQAGGLH